jgi:hypothetical protein
MQARAGQVDARRGKGLAAAVEIHVRPVQNQPRIELAAQVDGRVRKMPIDLGVHRLRAQLHQPDAGGERTGQRA